MDFEQLKANHDRVIASWQAEEEAWRQINDDLRAKLAEAQKDAERYRWLRQFQWLGNGATISKHWPEWGPGTACPKYQDALDAAIDAASAQSKREG